MKLCAVIPTFDNPRTIVTVASRVRAQIDAVVVVDDGSGPACTDAWLSLQALPGVSVLRRETNGGKGAAMRDGLLWAKERGFTHALQVDADGQHDLCDVPRLIEAARSNPEALVAAQPKFDDTAPKSRLFGRRISIFWLWVETGGTWLDPLCGFHIYPVARALAAGSRGNRMDFDPEILTRLLWSGTKVVTVPTLVRYLSVEDGGVSHFRMLRDNMRLFWLHTRLVCAMLLRFVRRA